MRYSDQHAISGGKLYVPSWDLFQIKCMIDHDVEVDAMGGEALS